MMLNAEALKEEIGSLGFAIVEDVFADKQIDAILSAIDKADCNKPTFRKQLIYLL